MFTYIKMEAKIKLSISAAIIIAVIISSYFGNILSTFTNSNSSSSNNSNNYSSSKSKLLRIGYFPNLNHAQAVIGFGTGDFQKVLGPDIKVEIFVFNAGPSAIEALLAKRIDATYVGSNPAINGYVVSDGKDLRIIAGSTSAGAVFVVRNDSGIQSPKDLGGKKFASPQLGNTQDIALRKYLLDNGYKTVENGGNVTVIPVANPDILTLFLKKEIDGAWIPEPWGARLLKEANGRIFLDERDLWPDGKFVTANIAVSTEYLKNNPDIIKKLLAAHVNETKWINDHKEDAIKIFNTELKKITGKTIPADELREALTRLEITYDPLKISLFRSANNAYDVGLLAQGKPRPDLSGIFDLTLLNQVLTEKGLTPIEGVGKAAVNTNATEGGFGTVE
ncbi:MAG TPA: ABC transporter substrate-binding protein [Nitrososphaeraceae archaeon]|nr:ABC transporter substrate-binding protein [Nitrososphaeraceae archaeon]